MDLGPPAKAGDRDAMDAAWESLRAAASAAGATQVLGAMDAVDHASGDSDQEYRVTMHALTSAVYEFCKSPLASAPVAIAGSPRNESPAERDAARKLTPDGSAFLAPLPSYLGLGVREPSWNVDQEGRFVIRYLWNDAIVARVSADPELKSWQVEDFLPTGTRASASYGRDFSSAAEQYARESLRDGANGPTGAWLLARVRSRANHFVLVPPDPDLVVSYVPAVAMVHLLAVIPPGSRPPNLAVGEGSDVMPQAMPFGPRATPTIVAKRPDGSVRTSVPIGLAEYIVPAIDAAQHIEQLTSDTAVVASKVPVIGAIFSGALAFGAKFAEGNDGERWVLDTGPASHDAGDPAAEQQ